MFPLPSNVTPASGPLPSEPTAKLCNTICFPDGLNRNRVPAAPLPPSTVIPYRLPALSRVNAACGLEPSLLSNVNGTENDRFWLACALLQGERKSMQEHSPITITTRGM